MVMDYKLHYEKLVERAKNRKLSGYCEKHHIVPICLNGSDDQSNIVELTAEEHYVAHLLLVKMYPDNIGLIWAVIMMTGGNKYQKNRFNNKLYGWARRKFAAKLSVHMTGKTHSEESKRKMSESRKGVKRGPMSDETKKKMSNASKGKMKSKAHRESMSKSKIGKKLNNYIKNPYRTRGENNPCSKLSENDILEIKRLLKENNLTQLEIAKLYNIDSSRVSKIKLNKLWSHIKID